MSEKLKIYEKIELLKSDSAAGCGLVVFLLDVAFADFSSEIVRKPDV
jgi:hypothetical protein